MKMLSCLLALVLTLGLTASLASEQSLGDVARELREKRAKEKKTPTKTFTNDNLPARPSGSGPSVAATIGEPGAPGVPVEPESSAPPPPQGGAVTDFGPSAETPPQESTTQEQKKSQEDWQSEFKAALESLAAREEVQRLAEDELSLLQIQQARELSSDVQAELAAKVKAKQAEVEASRKETAKAKKALEELEKALKESGAPAEWGKTD